MSDLRDAFEAACRGLPGLPGLPGLDTHALGDDALRDDGLGDDACPPPLSHELWGPVRSMLRRDVGIDSSCGTATLMLMGLVEPVRVLGIDGRTIRYTFDGTIFGAAELSTDYEFSTDITATEMDIIACLAPAYVASSKGCRIIVHDSLRHAWKNTHAAMILVAIRLARTRLGMHVASLAHIPLAQGGTLEDWVRLSASADEALHESSETLAKAVDSVRQRLDAVCKDLGCIEDMMHRHKRLALNSWRLV